MEPEEHSTHRQNQQKEQLNFNFSSFIIMLMYIELLINCVYTELEQNLLVVRNEQTLEHAAKDCH